MTIILYGLLSGDYFTGSVYYNGVEASPEDRFYYDVWIGDLLENNFDINPTLQVIYCESEEGATAAEEYWNEA